MKKLIQMNLRLKLDATELTKLKYLSMGNDSKPL